MPVCRAPFLTEFRAPLGQLGHQVLPFVFDLSGSARDSIDLSDRSDLAAVKRISSLGGLNVNGRKIGVDRQPRLRMLIEADQLRMLCVAARFTTQNGSGQ